MIDVVLDLLGRGYDIRLTMVNRKGQRFTVVQAVDGPEVVAEVRAAVESDDALYLLIDELRPEVDRVRGVPG